MALTPQEEYIDQAAKRQLELESQLIGQGQSKTAQASSKAYQAFLAGLSSGGKGKVTRGGTAAGGGTTAAPTSGGGVTDAGSAEAGLTSQFGTGSTDVNSLLAQYGITMPTFDTSGIQSETQGYTDLIAQYRDRLSSGLADQQAAIQAQYAQLAEQQESVGQQRLGGTRAFLGRAGAFSSASGQGAITSQVMANQQAMASLKAQEQSALAAAEQAYNDADFTALTTQIEVAQKAREEMNALQQQQFTNLLGAGQFAYDVQKAEREQKQRTAQFALEQISALDASQLEGLDTGYLSSLEESSGLPSGYFSGLAESMRIAQTKENDAEAFSRDVQLQELALKIPEGTTVTIGNSKVKGLQALEPMKQSWLVEDGNGNATLVTFDERTGETTSSFMPGVGGVDRTDDTTDLGLDALDGLAQSLIDGEISSADLVAEYDPDVANAVMLRRNQILSDLDAGAEEAAAAEREALFGGQSLYSPEGVFLGGFNLPGMAKSGYEAFMGAGEALTSKFMY